MAPVAAAVAGAIAAADSIYANTPNYTHAHTYAANQPSNENWSVNFPNAGGHFMVEDTENAFWTFGRGQRMPDLRRMLRQYGTPYGFTNDDAVFPSGISNLNAAAFEHAVNFAISDAERTNLNVVASADGTMCVDRKP